MSPDEGQEELEEVQADIKKKDEEVRIRRYAHIYFSSGEVMLHLMYYSSFCPLIGWILSSPAATTL